MYIHPAIEEQFDGIIAVDHFNLRYGIVSEQFKDAEDYRAAFNDLKPESEEQKE